MRGCALLWVGVAALTPVSCSTVSPVVQPEAPRSCLPSPAPELPEIHHLECGSGNAHGLCYSREDGMALALWADAMIEWARVVEVGCGATAPAPP